MTPDEKERIAMIEADLDNIKRDVMQLDKELKDIREKLYNFEVEFSKELNILINKIESVNNNVKLISKIPTIIIALLTIINLIITIMLNAGSLK